MNSLAQERGTGKSHLRTFLSTRAENEEPRWHRSGFYFVTQNIRIDTSEQRIVETNKTKLDIRIFLFIYVYDCMRVWDLSSEWYDNVLSDRVRERERVNHAHQISGYFQGNLNGNFSVMVFNALLAIFTGSKPEETQSIEIDRKSSLDLLSSSSGKGIGPFLSAVNRPSQGGAMAAMGSSFFLILY